MFEILKILAISHRNERLCSNFFQWFLTFFLFLHERLQTTQLIIVNSLILLVSVLILNVIVENTSL